MWWWWGREGGAEGEVKDEALAQANVRMELTGLEKAVGGAVLGRRWEFKVGFAVCEGCQFQCIVGSSCPRDHGRSKAQAWKVSAWAPDGSPPCPESVA